MSTDRSVDLTEFSMIELFRLEVENQSVVFAENLLVLEQDPTDGPRLETLMRVAHSLKGAALMVDCEVAARVAHELENVFVAAQEGSLLLAPEHVDVLFRSLDLIHRIAQAPEGTSGTGRSEHDEEVQQFLLELAKVCAHPPSNPANGSSKPRQTQEISVLELPALIQEAEIAVKHLSKEADDGPQKHQRYLRVTPENLDRLLALAGESLVESRRLVPFLESLLRLKRQHNELAHLLDRILESLSQAKSNEPAEAQIGQARAQLIWLREELSKRLLEFGEFHRRSTNLSHRLYGEALACRMRPFADGVCSFPRMVRDLARDLGKKVRLEIHGPDTYVDRDILEKLESPLTHLLRNAIDHGIEQPEARCLSGKPGEGVIRLEARESAGNLLVTVADDGHGINLANLRVAVLQKKLTTAEAAGQMTDNELLEFLLLPGFTTRQKVTETSGRGVGLDAVQAIVREVRGEIRILTKLGHGTTFQVRLPLTLAIVRALVVEIGKEPYAFPLSHITRALRVAKKDIQVTAGRQHFRFENRPIGLIAANQIFGGAEDNSPAEQLSVVVIGNDENCYAWSLKNFLVNANSLSSRWIRDWERSKISVLERF